MMPDREAKKKALDIMIVMGGKPKGDESYEDKKECECPCCGMPCVKCEDMHSEDKSDSYEKDEEESEEDESEDKY
jgi:hypothetical protein